MNTTLETGINEVTLEVGLLTARYLRRVLRSQLGGNLPCIVFLFGVRILSYTRIALMSRRRTLKNFSKSGVRIQEPQRCQRQFIDGSKNGF